MSLAPRPGQPAWTACASTATFEFSVSQAIHGNGQAALARLGRLGRWVFDEFHMDFIVLLSKAWQMDALMTEVLVVVQLRFREILLLQIQGPHSAFF